MTAQNERDLSDLDLSMTFNVFNEFIHQSEDICLNCFSRIREREPYDQDALRESLRGTLGDDVEKTKMATTVYQNDSEPSQSRSVHCANCGSDRECLNRPASMERALELADNLTERFNESERFEIDNNLLRKEIRQLKGQSSNQKYDNSIYSEAVNLSVAICD